MAEEAKKFFDRFHAACDAGLDYYRASNVARGIISLENALNPATENQLIADAADTTLNISTSENIARPVKAGRFFVSTDLRKTEMKMHNAQAVVIGQVVSTVLYNRGRGVVFAVHGEQKPASVGSLSGCVSYGGNATFEIAFESGGISRGLPESILHGKQWSIFA